MKSYIAVVTLSRGVWLGMVILPQLGFLHIFTGSCWHRYRWLQHFLSSACPEKQKSDTDGHQASGKDKSVVKLLQQRKIAQLWMTFLFQIVLRRDLWISDTLRIVRLDGGHISLSSGILEKPAPKLKKADDCVFDCQRARGLLAKQLQKVLDLSRLSPGQFCLYTSSACSFFMRYVVLIPALIIHIHVSIIHFLTTTSKYSAIGN